MVGEREGFGRVFGIWGLLWWCWKAVRVGG